MKTINGIILFTGFALYGSAQQKNFLYIQTDNGQPFYVKKGNEVLSSSASGHVVLPALADSALELRVGFPKGEVPEQQFSYSSGGKDQGVVLKNFGEKGWGLFNLQTLAVTYSGAAAAKMGGGGTMNVAADTVPASSGGKMARPGGFIDRLATVVDDPSIRIKPELPAKVEVVKQTPPKIDSAVVVKNNALPDKVEIEKEAGIAGTDLKSTAGVDSAQTSALSVKEEKPVAKEEEKLPEIKNVPSLIKSNVVRKSMTKLDSGHMGIFIDEYSNGKRDTIKVFIPQDGLDASDKEKVNEPVEKKEDVAFLDFSLKNGEGTRKNNVDSSVKILEQVDSATATGDKLTDSTVQIVVDSVRAMADSAVVIDSAVNVIIDTAVVAVDTAFVVLDANSASEQDMLQLRRKMAAEAGEEEMVDVARKEFRKKKFAVAQIRHLALLFLKEEGRYAFLDAAYGNVTDKEQFFTLEDLLKEPYYINRFKALLGK